MIYREFTLRATYWGCFHSEDEKGGLALNIAYMFGRHMYDSEQVWVCFCLHWKVNCYQEQTMRRFYSRCLQSEDLKMNLLWTFQMYKVIFVTVGRYLLLLALIIKLLSRKIMKYFILNSHSAWNHQVDKTCILTLYILPLSHFPVFTNFSNAFILAAENSHSHWKPEPASCMFYTFRHSETISICLLVFK